jgi:hypothetical protein
LRADLEISPEDGDEKRLQPVKSGYPNVARNGVFEFNFRHLFAFVGLF